MKIVKSTAQTLCDNGACPNKAEYLIIREDTLLANSLNFCSACVKELGSLFTNIFSPRPVGNLIKKAQQKNRALGEGEKK